MFEIKGGTMSYVEKSYIGTPYGVAPAEIFESDVRPTREELGTRFARIEGPFTKVQAVLRAKSTCRAVKFEVTRLESTIIRALEL